MKKRLQIIAFFGILLSFMALLSLMSYSAADQAAGDVGISDLWKVLTNDEALQARARSTDNLLGLLGAIVSNVLINATIGYAVLVLPILGFLWSIALLRRSDLRRITILTNYALAFAFLFSALCGTVRLLGDQPLMSTEWSGAVGDFLASVMTQLIGVTGTILVLMGATVTLIVALADIDLANAAGRLKGVGSTLGHSATSVATFVGKTVGSVKASMDRRSASSVRITKPEQEIPPARPEQPPRRPPVPIPEVEQAPAPPAVSRPAVEPQEDTDLELSIKEKVVEEEVDFDQRDQDAADEDIDFVPPSVDLLEPSHVGEQVDENELRTNAELLKEKLLDFGVTIESVSVTPGPVVTLYELVPAPGVKISKIESLEDDIALALKAKGIRIIAPIPGKGTVGVEIPNHNPSLVRIRGVINSSKFRDSKFPLPIALGKTISGEVFVDDLSRMPHLLIAGATGSGKSVGINVILASFIYRIHPGDVKFVIIDPKKIELSLYAKLARHYLAVSPDVPQKEEILTTPANAVLALKSVELEMERRYDRLAAAGVRNLSDYNERLKAGRLHDTETIKHRKLPYLIVVIDELADLMITAAREVEEPIARLAQLARAVGIHLVLATQRPSVDVITGVIKANFPARIAYQVASKIDSRTILDMNGAEQLLGNGDMLYLPPGSPKPVRIQNAFISTEEVESIVSHIAKQKGFSHPATLPSVFERRKAGGLTGNGSRDELFEEAARLVVRHQQGSVSLLQRRLKVGYSRAARLVDELEAAGIVGPFDGSKAREVLVETDEELTVILRSMV